MLLPFDANTTSVASMLYMVLSPSCISLCLPVFIFLSEIRTASLEISLTFTGVAEHDSHNLQARFPRRCVPTCIHTSATLHIGLLLLCAPVVIVFNPFGSGHDGTPHVLLHAWGAEPHLAGLKIRGSVAYKAGKLSLWQRIVIFNLIERSLLLQE